MLENLDLKNCEYGCIPRDLMADLRQEGKSSKIKIRALEFVEAIMEEKSNYQLLLPHIGQFMNFLSNVTRDVNNNVITKSLQLINKTLVNDASVVTKIQIDEMIPMLIQKIGDANSNVRTVSFDIFATLNNQLHPKSYMNMIIPYLTMSTLPKDEIIECF